VKGLSPRTSETPSEMPQFLHVLRISCPDGKREHLISPVRMDEWSVSPDGTGALGLAKGHSDVQDGLYYVNLYSNRIVPLDSGELSQWQRDGKAAFRVRKIGTNSKWLCRFDTQTAEETPLLRIPDGQRLTLLSPTARFAILSREGMRPRPLSLVHVATGRKKVLDVSWLSTGAIARDDWTRDFPWASAWAADETAFVLPHSGMTKMRSRAYLYHTPDGWLGR